MIAIFVGSFVCVLASSTINVALPVLQKHFDTTLGSIQWTLTGFMLAMGTIAPIVGYLGERFSYKRLFLVSLIGFTLSSALCAAAWDEYSLIAFRILQGIFSGLILPTTMAIIYQVVPRERQPMAIALWALSSMLAPAFGPTFAGWLLQEFDWQWLFLINIPVGIIGAVLVAAFIPYYRLSVPKNFDGLGFVTVIVGSSSLLLALGEGQKWGWSSAKIISLLVLGIVAIFAFVWRELTAKSPLLNLRVFANGRYTLNTIIVIILTISLYSGTFLTPVFLQQIQQVSTMDTGLILLPASLVMALIMPIIGKLYSSIGPRVLMCIGIVLLAVGTFMLSSLSIDVSHSYIVWWMLVRNLGISFVMMPASNASMETVPRDLSGHASSISNWTRNVFGSFAIAIFTAMLSSRGAHHGKALALAGDTDANHIQMQAFTMSVNDVYLLATFVVAVALPLALFVNTVKRSKQAEQASPTTSATQST
ncbi:DHA2 family efflux MFS transporter permease subunit [Paenibacillus rhizovicinus]|uniref:DHA2 family efflux MFS transporter permease subunit n=1 Tax=Paenibacillus rhizovicinus TaxID=2704463 RepID=A0A6C0P8Z2_9BACL|nr:DHA2 family efflux MFS transporter permease subunit [Paenibacillus rhizovicinus]